MKHLFPLILMLLLISQMSFANDTADSLLVRSNIDSALQQVQIGAFQKVLPWVRQALSLHNKHFSKPNLQLAEIHNIMAIGFLETAQHDSCLYHLEVSAAFLETFGATKHLLYVDIYDIKAKYYGSVGDIEKSLQCYEKALNITLETFGKAHPRTGIFYNNIAYLYAKKRESAKALHYYKRTLDIFEKYFGKNHLYVANVWNNIGKANVELNEFEEALEALDRALDIINQVEGPLTSSC